MTISATALYGSQARGDQNADSDTDLLMVVDGASPPRHSALGRVSLSFYSRDDLKARARTGDLFLWHVLSEGRVLYDPDGIFNELRGLFRLRKSYSREIRHAAAVGWLLVHFQNRFAHSSLAARRAAWAVRSVLIARSAEAGEARFAAAALSAFAAMPQAGRLIGQKGADGFSRARASDLRVFLTTSGFEDPVPSAQIPEDYLSLLESDQNTVGLHILKNWDRAEPAYG